MNYSLGGERLVGERKRQTVIVEFNDTAASTSANKYDKLKDWAETLYDFDASGSLVTNFAYHSLTEKESSGTGNSGGHADVSIVVKSDDTDVPTLVMLEVSGVTLNNVVSNIQGRFLQLTGKSLSGTHLFITSAVFTLKN